jgi:uncharacterized membrane protein
MKLIQDKKNRPRLKLELTSLDRILEATALILLILLFVLPAVYYNQLPERIPSHFNARGGVDSYGSRFMVWLLPMTGLFVYILLTILSRYPHVFNFPVEVTAENAERLYRAGLVTIRIMKSGMLLLFLYITWLILRVALKKETGLGVYFLPVLIGIMILVLVVMFMSMMKKK